MDPQWTTIMDIGTVLLSIQSLLNNNPLDNEPGYSNRKLIYMINIVSV